VFTSAILREITLILRVKAPRPDKLLFIEEIIFPYNKKNPWGRFPSGICGFGG
jgi:hypothetical protein